MDVSFNSETKWTYQSNWYGRAFHSHLASLLYLPSFFLMFQTGYFLLPIVSFTYTMLCSFVSNLSNLSFNLWILIIFWSVLEFSLDSTFLVNSSFHWFSFNNNYFNICIIKLQHMHASSSASIASFCLWNFGHMILFLVMTINLLLSLVYKKLQNLGGYYSSLIFLCQAIRIQAD